jgi:hypothetical protein
MYVRTHLLRRAQLLRHAQLPMLGRYFESEYTTPNSKQ